MLNYYDIREAMNVTLKAIKDIPACKSFTGRDIKMGEPVMYFEYLKVSDIIRTDNNSEKDQQMTFHIKDALISPTSMALLTNSIMYHRTVSRNTLIIPTDNILKWNNTTGQNLISLSNTKFDDSNFIDFESMKVRYYSADNGLVVKRLSTRDLKFLKNTNEISIINVPGPITEVLDLVILSQSKSDSCKKLFKHEKQRMICQKDGELRLRQDHVVMIDENHPFFLFIVNEDGGLFCIDALDQESPNCITKDPDTGNHVILTLPKLEKGKEYIIDYYKEVRGNTTSLVVVADLASDFYYLEGQTTIRRETDGCDIPVMITAPKVKLRNNFEIKMTSTGEHSPCEFIFDLYKTTHPDYPENNDISLIIDIIQDEEENPL